MKTTMTRRTPAKTRIRNFFDHRPTLRASSSHNIAEYKQVATRPLRTPHGNERCGDNVIADLDASGNLVRSYCTPMLDNNLSTTDHADSQNLVTSYYNSDERQSVVNLTDSTGVVVNDYAYSAYGDKIDALTGGSVEQRYTYTGRELSDTTGDFYFRYRWYGAGVGGFMSRDPLGYVDGQGLYNAYFAMRMALDQFGGYTDTRQYTVPIDDTETWGSWELVETSSKPYGTDRDWIGFGQEYNETDCECTSFNRYKVVPLYTARYHKKGTQETVIMIITITDRKKENVERALDGFGEIAGNAPGCQAIPLMIKGLKKSADLPPSTTIIHSCRKGSMELVKKLSGIWRGVAYYEDVIVTSWESTKEECPSKLVKF